MATVKVPADYAEAFRDAVLAEIHWDSSHITGSVEEVQQFIARDREQRRWAEIRKEEIQPPAEVNPGDVVGNLAGLNDSLALLEPAEARETEITGDTATLAHTMQTMADKVLTPKLVEAVNVSPVEESVIEEVSGLTSAIEWAVRESARLETEWQAAHEAEKTAEVAA